MFGNSGNKNLQKKVNLNHVVLMQLQNYLILVTKNYREFYNIHAANGILFNHKSPLRGETFV